MADDNFNGEDLAAALCSVTYNSAGAPRGSTPVATLTGPNIQRTTTGTSGTFDVLRPGNGYSLTLDPRDPSGNRIPSSTSFNLTPGDTATVAFDFDNHTVTVTHTAPTPTPSPSGQNDDPTLTEPVAMTGDDGQQTPDGVTDGASDPPPAADFPSFAAGQQGEDPTIDGNGFQTIPDPSSSFDPTTADPAPVAFDPGAASSDPAPATDLEPIAVGADSDQTD